MSRHNRLLQKFVDRVRATVELRKMRKNNQTPTKEQEEKAYNLTTFDDKKVLDSDFISLLIESY
jgi:hypothetical protein